MASERFKKKRINFLWSLATEYVYKSPSLSRFYINSMREFANEANVKLADDLIQNFCHFCGTIFQPESSRTRVIPKCFHKSKTKRKSKRKLKEYHKTTESRNPRKDTNQVAVLCKTCGRHSYFLGSQRQTSSTLAKLGTVNSSKLLSSSPVLSKSAQKRQQRKSRTAQLKSLLSHAEEVTKSQASPNLRDFLSSLS